MRIGKRFLVTAVLFLLASPLMVHADDIETDRGPLRLINEYPLEIIFLAWPLQDPGLSPPGQWMWSADLSLSNTYKDERSDSAPIVIADVESFRLSFGVSRRLAPRWQAGVQFNFLNYGGGFLDPFIRGVEKHLWFRRRQTDRGQDNQFRYLLRWDGHTVIDKSGGSYSGLGDTQLLLKRDLGPLNRPWSFAAVGAFKIPTGRVGLGSGGVDAGLGIAARYQKTRWKFRGEIDAVVLSDFKDIPTNNRAVLKFGVEYVRTRFSLYLQSDLRSRAITWGKGTLDESPFLFALGGKFAKPANVVHQIYIIEDLSRVSPDVTLGYGIEW